MAGKRLNGCQIVVQILCYNDVIITDVFQRLRPRICQGDSKICDISDDVRDELRKFRFRKSTKNSALILKINREKQLLVLDELLDDISVRELQESLPGHQPRYVIYTYKMIHDDSRISYPMCFIFYTPRDSQMELQMMYAYTKSALQREINLTRVYEIRELDELTEEWLKEKLK